VLPANNKTIAPIIMNVFFIRFRFND
jgi:hypothetical protein